MYEVVTRKQIRDSIKAINQDTCNRCLSHNLLQDYNGIKYCLDCYQYLEINNQMYLLRREREYEHINHPLELDFDLTQEQTTGSNFLVNCFLKRKNAFLQAVCGAGKTEMSLALIHMLLNEFKTIAFVIPRVEIIKQVSLRMSQYFPKTSISTLYSGQTLKEDSQLIILTPQQLIKFYREFDLMIIDEVDAFPFLNNPFLERLVKKSKKESAVLIYMSATITEGFKKEIKNKNLEFHLIPRRYHNRDLEVPVFLKIGGFNDYVVLEIVRDYVIQKKPLIIYVSSIFKGELLLEKLNEFKVDLISSKTKYKKAVIKAFKDKNLDILISTTILERGITFNVVNVIVLEADKEVFNEASLIQIAGRVGRVKTEGDIIFMSRFKSKAMVSAKKKIINFNNS
ncbi:MAG: DEAD/DEAH box helicase family protein [Candidatus Izemoplasmatales bacterium]|nr:DEAD/DEAH box helicase family protein [Candidatus Izemoplasmatales bacterium]